MNSVALFAIKNYDLVQRTVLELKEPVGVLSLNDAQNLFLNARRRFNIRGKAFILKSGSQSFFISKTKATFKVYELEDSINEGKLDSDVE